MKIIELYESKGIVISLWIYQIFSLQFRNHRFGYHFPF
jgi:hypothetical protein